MEMLAPFSALPAIMCSRGVSNGPWLSFPPPFPFHFLITSPPALSHWSSDKIIPLLFSPSTPSHTSWLKHDPKEAGNGHLQYSFLSLALCLSCTICLPPPLLPGAHTWNRSQIISSTLSVVRQLLSLLVTSSHPAASPCLTLRGPSSIISIPHTRGSLQLWC